MTPQTPNDEVEVNAATNNPVPTTEIGKCNAWYSPLCQVTKTSKIFAAVVMIILPFVGGYVGYQISIAQSSTKTTEIKNASNETQSVSLGTILPFTVNLPLNWGAQSVTSENTDLYLPKGAFEYTLLSDSDTQILISPVPLASLRYFFGCYEYVFNASMHHWIRIDESKTDQCVAEDYVRSNENVFLEANITHGGLKGLRTFGTNPVTILSPVSEGFGVQINIINHDDTFDRLSDEVLSILNSFTFDTSKKAYMPPDFSKEMLVTELASDLFNEYFVSAGDFTVASVTASAIYGRRLYFLAGNPDIQLTGTAKVEFSYHYGGWVTTFTPDETSLHQLPILKGGPNVSFYLISDDHLCEELFKCKSVDDILRDTSVYSSPVYETQVVITNPSLGYEVIPSDAGTHPYTIGFEMLEVLP